MPNPRTNPITTINSTTATEVVPPTGFSLGGTLQLIRLYNDSDTDMDYANVVDNSTPTAAQVRSGGSTLLKQTSRLVTINTQSKLFVVSDSGSSKKLDVDWLGIQAS